MKFLKNFFVIKKNNQVRRTRFFSLGWRFFVGFLLFFYVLTGLSPLDILNRVIASFEEDLEVINLYSTSCESFTWNDNINTLSVPEVSPDGDKYLFNSSNSASTKDNGSELVCSNFLPLVDYNSKIEVQKLESDYEDSPDSYQADSVSEIIEEDEDLDVATSSEEKKSIELVSTSTDELLNSDDELATSTDDSENEENEENWESAQVVEDMIGEEGEDIEDVIENSDFSTTSEDVIEEGDIEEDEIIDLDDDFIEEAEDDLASTSDISLLDAFKNFSSNLFDQLSSLKLGLIARAEEILGKDVEKLEELGEFSAARIKFSAAIIENQIVEVVDVNSLEVNQQDPSTSAHGDSFVEVQEEIIQEEGDIDIGTSSEEKLIVDSDYIEEVEIINVDTEEVPERDPSASAQDDSFVEVEEIVIDEGEDISTEEEEVSIDEEEVIAEEEKEEEEEELEKEEEGDEVPEEKEEDFSVPVQDDDSEEVDDLSRYNILESKIIKNANAQVSDIGFNFWYSITSASSGVDNLWIKFDEFRGDNFSNKNNDGYFSFDAPFLESWNDIENLKVKI